MKCEYLISDKQTGEIRTCNHPATYEVIAISTDILPEEHYEVLCSQHARKIENIAKSVGGLAPDIRIRSLGN
jgi:hypothetical protein